MSEQEKAVVVDYCNRMDERHKRLVSIIYLLLTIAGGTIALMFISFGEVRAQSNNTATRVEKTEVNKVDRSEFTLVVNKLDDIGKKVDAFGAKVGSLEGTIQEHTRTSR